jgi:hypothetical protein
MNQLDLKLPGEVARAAVDALGKWAVAAEKVGAAAEIGWWLAAAAIGLVIVVALRK